MNAKIEKTGKNVVKLEITVDAKKFEEGMQSAFQRMQNRFNIPGFRKGKAPRNIVERYYGEGILYEEAFNIVGADEYDKVIKENNIEAIDRPEIDIVEIGSGKDMVFTAIVTVKPEVELGKYKGIEVKKNVYNVTTENILHELEHMREHNARIVSVDDRPAAEKDTAVIDFEGFIDGNPFEGGKGTKYNLEIGSKSFIPGFEEQIIGMKIGEDKTIDVKFPEDYQSKDFAGKDAQFKIHLHELKVKELPEADDEFAKDVSEFSTIEELKSDIEAKLTKENEERAQKELEDELIKKIAENAKVDVPQAMIEKQIDSMVKEFEWRLKMQRLSLQEYLNATQMDYSKFRLGFASNAESVVKSQLTLEAVFKAEGIEVTDEDVEVKLNELAQKYDQKIEDFKEHLKEQDIQYIKDEMKFDKTIKFLVENAK